MRLTFICASVLLCLCYTLSVADDETNAILLPKTHVMPLWSANSTAHRISAAKMFENNNYIGSMGGAFPLVSVSRGDKVIQASIASTLYTQLVRPPGHLQVVNVDFFVDLFFDVLVAENVVVRFGPGHTSQHLTDDALELLHYPPSINYVRDYWQLFGCYQIPQFQGNLYGGFYYNYKFKTQDFDPNTPDDAANRMIYEFGGEIAPVRLAPSVFIYTGLDLKLRGEASFGASQNYQVGVKYSNSDGRTVRFAFNHRAGLEERGQFFLQHNTFNTFALYFDF